MKRDRKGRFAHKRSRWDNYGLGVVVLLMLGTAIGGIYEEGIKPVRVIQAYHDHPKPPQEVRLAVHIDWTEERIIEEIHRVFPDAPIMERVAWCESRHQPSAQGPTDDHGVFQIHRPSHPQLVEGKDLYDVQTNLALARYLYDRDGLQPWNASRHCWDT